MAISPNTKFRQPFSPPKAGGYRPQPVIRRQSTFDPMDKGDAMDGDFDGRSPFKPDSFGKGKGRENSISLPGIKALFGIAGGETPVE